MRSFLVLIVAAVFAPFEFLFTTFIIKPLLHMGTMIHFLNQYQVYPWQTTIIRYILDSRNDEKLKDKKDTGESKS